jgi:hypothetical protein
MAFLSWLFGSSEDKAKGTECPKSLIARIKGEVDATIEEPSGDTQRFIKAELDAAKEAEEKRVEHEKETDEKVEAHRKRADTEMRKVAEKTLGMSDIFVKKNGEWVTPEPLTEEEQEAARARAVENIKNSGWRESRA